MSSSIQPKKSKKSKKRKTKKNCLTQTDVQPRWWKLITAAKARKNQNFVTFYPRYLGAAKSGVVRIAAQSSLMCTIQVRLTSGKLTRPWKLHRRTTQLPPWNNRCNISQHQEFEPSTRCVHRPAEVPDIHPLPSYPYSLRPISRSPSSES